MSEKTDTYVPKFYLVNPEQTLCITRRMTLGRTNGDFVLEDMNLSSTHCEFTPRLLECFITDLNSTNGVFVNKVKIFPATEVKLHVGDSVRIGSREWIFYDNEDAAKKANVEAPQKAETFKLSDFITFFSAPVQLRVLYFMTIVAGIISFAVNLRLEIPFPANLQMLGDLYADLIVVNGIRSLLIILGASLVHSLIYRYLLKDSIFLKVVSIIPFLATLFFLINFKDGPVWYVKDYIVNRQMITDSTDQSRRIVKLKGLTNLENDFTAAFKETRAKLNKENEKALKDDFEKHMKLLKKQIDDLTPKRQD